MKSPFILSGHGNIKQVNEDFLKEVGRISVKKKGKKDPVKFEQLHIQQMLDKKYIDSVCDIADNFKKLINETILNGFAIYGMNEDWIRANRNLLVLQKEDDGDKTIYYAGIGSRNLFRVIADVGAGTVSLETPENEFDKKYEG